MRRTAAALIVPAACAEIHIALTTQGDATAGPSELAPALPQEATGPASCAPVLAFSAVVGIGALWVIGVGLRRQRTALR